MSRRSAWIRSGGALCGGGLGRGPGTAPAAAGAEQPRRRSRSGRAGPAARPARRQGHRARTDAGGRLRAPSGGHAVNLALIQSQWRALRAAAVQAFLSNAFDGFIVFTLIVQPLVIALLGLWILRGTAEDYGMYVVVGSGLTGLWSGLLFISGNSITSERWTGTLEMIASLPPPLAIITLGQTMANVSQSLVSMIGAYLLASIFLGYPLTVNQPILFTASLVLMVFAFVSLGMVMAPLFITNPDVQR